jgi:hypothetical protein
MLFISVTVIIQFTKELQRINASHKYLSTKKI